MYFSGFQNNAFQRNAFQILIEYVPLPLGLKGAGHYRKHNKAFTQSVKESLHELLDEPVIVEQIREAIEPYSKTKDLSFNSINFRELSRNVEYTATLFVNGNSTNVNTVITDDSKQFSIVTNSNFQLN